MRLPSLFKFIYKPASPLRRTTALRSIQQAESAKNQIDSKIAKEKLIFSKASQQWAKLRQQYVNRTCARHDRQPTSEVQLIDGRQYTSKRRLHQGRDYMAMFCRDKEGNEVSFLDIMQITFLKPFRSTMELTKLNFNSDHSMALFGLDLNNDELVSFYLLKKGRVRNLRLQNCTNALFYRDRIYYLETEQRRPCRLWSCDQDFSNKVLIYEDFDSSHYLDIRLSGNKASLLLDIFTKAYSELLVLDEGKMKPLLGRDRGNCFSDLQADKLYCVESANNCLKAVTAGKEQLLYQVQTEAQIKDVDYFKDYIVIYSQTSTTPTLHIYHKPTGSAKIVKVPGPSDLQPSGNRFFQSDSASFLLNTPFAFNQQFRVDLASGYLTKILAMQLDGPKFFQQKYVVREVRVPAKDGQSIPMTLMHRKNIKLNRSSKTVVHSYGCYGQSHLPSFNLPNLTALERGFVVAYAHVRGGGQLGKNWAAQAKSKLYLPSLDIEDCLNYLFAQGFTNPALAALKTSSAGAVNVMALVNRRPLLVKALVLNVPFLMLLQTLMQPQLPITQSDHHWFGNPTTSNQNFQKLKGICPHQRLRKVQYPAIYITAGLKDYRCPIGGILSFVDTFRQLAVNPTRVQPFAEKNLVVKVRDQGHAGAVATNQALQQQCDEWSFLQWVLTEGNKQVSIK